MTKQKKNSIYKLRFSNSDKIVIIDRDQKKRVKKYNWYLHFIKKNNSYYAEARIKGKIVRLHNFIMKFTPKDRKFSVDHINRDTLDNRKSNLRIVNQTIQTINRKIGKNNVSHKIGVYLEKNQRRWVAKWAENKKIKKQPFYYRDQESFQEAFVKAFIFRKDKERELEDYRFAMSLPNTRYFGTIAALYEPYIAFKQYMEKNKGKDFNFL